MNPKPIISIVGRPNVGKSSLFNRLVGYRKAITEDTPGVTRDRNYGDLEYAGYNFRLVDTGGFEPVKEEGYFPLMRQQIITSLEESTMIIFLLDGKEGLLHQDMEIAKGLRKYGKPIFYVVNKVDSGKREVLVSEFYALGTEKLYPLSSLHGLGIDELLEDLVKEWRVMSDEGRGGTDTTQEAGGIRIAFVGKPFELESSRIA